MNGEETTIGDIDEIVVSTGLRPDTSLLVKLEIKRILVVDKRSFYITKKDLFGLFIFQNISRKVFDEIEILYTNFT